MRINDLVSVIVPCYNVEIYVATCLESILTQTYCNLEIILVDDGSPDKCGEICDCYSKRDLRIKVIHKQNGGLSDARNVAIDVAKGEWITFIDSDDYVAPNYVERLLSLAIDNGCKCSVVQPILFVDGTNPVKKNKNTIVEIMDSMDAISAMFYQTKLDTSAWNKLYHHSLFSTGIRYPKGYLFEDNPTTYRLLALCEKIAVSNEKLYYYRIREGSIEGQDFTPQKLNQGLEIIQMMENFPEITNRVLKSFNCKKASLALHFVMKMPLDYTNKDVLWKFVKQNRWNVVRDKKARLKTRIGCLLSYLGIPIMKSIYKLVSDR